MKNTHATSPFVLFALFVFPFFASIHLTGQEPLSLAQAIALSLENRHNIAIAQAELAIDERNNHPAIAGKYPTIDLAANLQTGYTNQNNPASFLTTLNSFQSGITPSARLDWILFDGYRVRTTEKQLSQIVQQGEIEVKLAVQQTTEQVILAYYNALIQAEQLDVLREILKLSYDRINYQEVRKQFGQSSGFDVLQTTDAYLNDSTSYLIQVDNLDRAYRNLNIVMGLDDIRTEFELTTPLDYDAPTYEINALRTKMMGNNYQLQNLAMVRELANTNTKIAESAKYPTIALGTQASYNANLSSGSGTFGDGRSLELDAVVARTFNYGINVTASYRLFDGGTRKINIENAQTRELIAQQNISQTKQQLTGELENTYYTYLNQVRLYELTQARIENAERNIEIAEERFKGGQINSFDYRTVQVNYINASQARLNALFNLKNTETTLIRLTGGLVQ